MSGEQNLIENKCFQLDPIFDNVGEKLQWKPAGEYWIYQQNGFQYCWWSYNLQKLKEAVNHQGGVVTDKNGNIIFSKFSK